MLDEECCRVVLDGCWNVRFVLEMAGNVELCWTVVPETVGGKNSVWDWENRKGLSC